jgi:ectoine hydroxylase-related dioxygenase (phytanoyl-CoA dioxygenase family)
MIKRNYGYLAHRATDEVSESAKALERDGYAVVRNIFDKREVAALREDIDRIFSEYAGDQRIPRPPEAEDMFRYAMLNRSEICRQAIGHRGILDVIEPLLGEDCHVIANTAWRNPPNSTGTHGGERWHIDAGPHIPLPPGSTWPSDIPHPVFAIGTHIYLQDCTLEDGPTGVIPGSHLSGRTPPSDELLNDDLTYNEQAVVPLITQAGDVGFFVSDIWHRRMTTMPGDQGRYFLQVHYGRRDIAQRLVTTQQCNQLSAQAIANASSEREKTLIGLHPPFFYDG